MTIRTKAYQPGDTVVVLDTSNKRELEGFVRMLDGKRVQVYITRFKNTMWFDEGGLTRLGRFKLQGRV